MAVPAGPTEKRYTGNGVTTIFTIPFLLLSASDLNVFLDGVEISSGFTVTGAGNPTSTVTFTVAPADQSAILLQLDVPFERLNDYQENGDFLSSTVNRDFDRIWQALKQLLRVSGRALTLGFFDVDGAGAYRAKQNRISDLGDPVSAQDATNKRYVDTADTSVRAEIVVAVSAEASARASADANLQAQLTGNVPLEASAFSPISWHVQTLLNSVVIPDYVNAWSYGPTLTIAPGQTITIGFGSAWTIAAGGEFVSSSTFNTYKTATNNRLTNLETNYLPIATFNDYVVSAQAQINTVRPLNGLSVSLFGDSITAYGLWIDAMLAVTGMNVVHNAAIAGAPWSMVMDQITSATVSGAQVINIWCGINDYFYSVPLGTIADANVSGANTFYKHVWQALDRALTLAPQAKLFVMSPMKSSYTTVGGFTYPAPNLVGVTLDQYRKAMEIMADRMGASFIDMFAKSHMTTYNNSIYTSDTIHPNSAGGAVCGKSAGILLNAG